MTENNPTTINLKDSQVEFLNQIVTQHNLPDVSKAVRILIEHAIAEEGMRDDIFGDIRCRDC